MPFDPREIELTAWHEAGHAIAAHLLGLQFDFAEVCERDGNLGFLKYSAATVATFRRPDVAAKVLLVALAGPLAENALRLGTHRLDLDGFDWAGATSADFRRAMDLAGGDVARIIRAAGEVLAMIERPAVWRMVGVVAEQLERLGAIRGHEVARICREVEIDERIQAARAQTATACGRERDAAFAEAAP